MTDDELAAPIRTVDAVPAAALGERPVWDVTTQTLLWVDIPAGQVRRYDPARGSDTLVVQTEGGAGCAYPRAGGGLVVATGGQFVLVGADGGVDASVALTDAEPGVSFNDGAVDPAGRLLAGTGDPDLRPGRCALYCLDVDHRVNRVFGDVTESNGLAWSPDGSTMYYVDSGHHEVRRYDYDVSTGAVSRVADLAVVDAEDGVPDGLVVDVAGCVWVALWEGSQVRRYSPDGDLLTVWPLPASLVTCPGFGGADLRDVYVTTAREGLTEAALADQPLAGRMFTWRAPEAGLVPLPYAG
jgi:sugar lactone lactonase YvrE